MMPCFSGIIKIRGNSRGINSCSIQICTVIVHVEHVCWKLYKMKNRQNDSNNLVLIPTKPRFGIESKFCEVILHKCFFQQTCSICTIFLLNSHEIFTTKSRFDVIRKSVTSRIMAVDRHRVLKCCWFVFRIFIFIFIFSGVDFRSYADWFAA